MWMPLTPFVMRSMICSVAYAIPACLHRVIVVAEAVDEGKEFRRKVRVREVDHPLELRAVRDGHDAGEHGNRDPLRLGRDREKL